MKNIVVAEGGQIASTLICGVESPRGPEFVSHIPWTRIVQPAHPGALIADFSDLRAREFDLFLGPAKKAQVPEFAISKLIGDYARLQSGLGLGNVSDLVFDRAGRLEAVVVSREASSGGGTYAFSYPGTTGQWNPHRSYYGLPYVTAEQATEAGRLDMHGFQQS